jgi:hypothetical protein
MVIKALHGFVVSAILFPASSNNILEMKFNNKNNKAYLRQECLIYQHRQILARILMQKQVAHSCLIYTLSELYGGRSGVPVKSTDLSEVTDNFIEYTSPE